ncbi:MAG: divalent metal cation transporter, partial [Acidobacteriia bacterium]|nr:divalent metal cation transporter [Terriglobia bacterium]
GVIGVGFLAVAVMTGGAAYDICQSVGWKFGISKKPAQARRFYAAIAGFTIIGMAINFLGINPMKALVFAGIVQGFSTPLMLLIIFMTNNARIMGDNTNNRTVNVLGWITTAMIFAATIALVVTWIV